MEAYRYKVRVCPRTDIAMTNPVVERETGGGLEIDLKNIQFTNTAEILSIIWRKDVHHQQNESMLTSGQSASGEK